VSFPILTFMAVTDYLAWSIRFLTPVLASFAVALILEVFLKRTERGLSEEEIAALTKNPSRTLRRRRLPWTVITVVASLAVFVNTIVYMAGVQPSTALFDSYRVAFPIIWYALASWYTQIPKLTVNWTRATYLLFLFVPALLPFSYFDGLYQGTKFRNVEINRYTLSRTSWSTPREARILIVLDKYIIVGDTAGASMSAIRSEEITEIWRHE